MKALGELLELFIVITIIFVLFTIEGLIVYILFFIENMMMGDSLPSRVELWRDIFTLIWYRILLCTFPQLLLYGVLGKRFISSKNLWKFSIFNVFAFLVVTIFLLRTLVNSLDSWADVLQDFFIGFTLMYYFIVAAFLSPIILNKLSFLRLLLTKWSEIRIDK